MAISGDLTPVVRDVALGAAGARRSDAAGGESQRAESAAGTDGAGRDDSVEVSEYARLLGKLADPVRTAPEERAQLIARLRASIDTGTYNVDARKVAERLLPGLERLP